MKFHNRSSTSPVMAHDDLRKVTPHCRVLMRGRLVGGARTIIPGEWSCAVCGAQDCWPTRRSCYKCGSLKTASPVQLGAFVNGYRGHFREQSGIGSPSPPTAPAPAPVPVVVPPRLTKSQKKRPSSVMLFPRLKSQLGKVIGTQCYRPFGTLGWMRVFWGRSVRKFPLRLPLKRKKRDIWRTFVTSGTRLRVFWIAWWRMRRRKRCTRS